MADGPNTNSGSKVASALNSIPFGNIIGGPLAACVRAQAEAAQTTIDFIRGFTMTNSELDPEGVEPITVTFTFIMNGEKTRMTVPLMTIVPIPYMHIDYIDLELHSGYHCMRRRKDRGEICYGRLYTHRGRRAIGIC